MKKSLLVLAVLLTMVAFSAAAVADVTGNLTLQGTVDDQLSLTVAGTGDYDDLTLTSDGNLVPVGTLTYWGNVAYDVTASTDFTFSGQTSGNSDTVTYKLFADSDEITSSNLTFVDGNPADSSSSNTSTLKISYPGNQFLTPDIYEDTITFTISAD